MVNVVEFVKDAGDLRILSFVTRWRGGRLQRGNGHLKCHIKGHRCRRSLCRRVLGKRLKRLRVPRGRRRVWCTTSRSHWGAPHTCTQARNGESRHMQSLGWHEDLRRKGALCINMGELPELETDVRLRRCTSLDPLLELREEHAGGGGGGASLCTSQPLLKPSFSCTKRIGARWPGSRLTKLGRRKGKCSIT